VGHQPSDSGLGNQLVHVCLHTAMNLELNHPGWVIDLGSLLTNCEPVLKRSATALATLSLCIHLRNPRETIARCKQSLTHPRAW